MKKPHFVRLTVTLTYYGVGKTKEDAENDALNEFYNDDHKERSSEKEFESVEDIQDTTIDQSYVDFLMSDEYEQFDETKKGGE
jgi:hypothetical protein